MEWTVEAITDYCKELAAKVGMEFDCPVVLNGRLSTTLGRLISTSGIDGYTPSRLEMSKRLLATATDESIKGVIEHEFCHWYVTKTTREHHGHDQVFRNACAMIGCTNDRAKTTVDRMVEASSIYKYTVNCPNCGVIGGYQRMNSTLRDIDLCTCMNCNSGGLTYTQNWQELWEQNMRSDG